MGVITKPNIVGATVSGIYADRSQTLIPFGDSITATMWRQYSLTGSITVSAGVATMTLSITHNIPVGTKFRLALASFAGYNDVFTVTATGSSTTVSFAAPSGAPASEAVVQHVAYFENDQHFQLNWVHALKAYSKQRFNIPYNGGVGGDHTSHALARVGQTVAACATYNAGRVIVQIGTNDMINAATGNVATSFANIQAICTAFLDIGVAVDLCTIPPLGTGHASVSDAAVVNFGNELNRLIRKYAKETNGLHLHDVYAWVSDPAQTNGQARANSLGTDGVHYNSVAATAASSAAYIVGKAMAANYAEWLGAPIANLPASQSDCYTFSASNKNKFSSCLMQPSGGTASTNTTGTVAAGWTAYVGAGTTQVASLEIRNTTDDGDAIGYNQKLVKTVTTGATGLFYSDPSARLTAGKTYVASCAVTVVKDAITYIQAALLIGFTAGGFARQIRAGLYVTPEDGNYVLETPPFVWPSGTSSPLFYLQDITNGSGSPVIEWGRVALVEID